MNRDAALWLRVLAGPLVWFASLEANFALAPRVPGLRVILILVSLASLIIVATAGFLGWRQWRRWEDANPAEATPGRRSLSLGGALLNGFSFIVILAQALPSFLAQNR